jgi:60 kDa SS-A/Ro ribonucleoprotein
MNKKLFETRNFGPAANTKNDAGGKAYSLNDRHALAQYAVTETFGGTAYMDAESNLDRLVELAGKVDSEFIAKLAIYSRKEGLMKDMPAFLCAVLFARHGAEDMKLLSSVFGTVLDNTKMLRNFMQIVRSGVLGRKSFGSTTKRLIQNWLVNRDPTTLFHQSIGNDPSLGDVIKMAHPHPLTKEQTALFAYLIGKQHQFSDLPEIVRHFEAFKKGETLVVPGINFQFLSALPLTDKDWTAICKSANWNTLRMNLNTFTRHNVFKDLDMVKFAADKLANPDQVRRAHVFPYQIMTAYMNYEGEKKIKLALQMALEEATKNVPELSSDQIYIATDVSGSMRNPVTGNRPGATSVVRCIDVAALISACLLRTNKLATVMPFEERVHQIDLNPMDSVMTNAQKLASINGGGTNCSCVMKTLNRDNAKGNLVIYVSDNQSWMDVEYNTYRRVRVDAPTELQKEWQNFKRRNPTAKLICIDITPQPNVQVKEREDILNIGGFSDKVFTLMRAYLDNGFHFEKVVEDIKLDEEALLTKGFGTTGSQEE